MKMVRLPATGCTGFVLRNSDDEEFKTVSDQILTGKYFHFIPDVSCIRGVNFVTIPYSQRRVHFVEKDAQ
jgi:hypothetical protein